MGIVLYGTPPSPPSHSARLMLEQKGLEHRIVWLLPGLWPALLRTRGFLGGEGAPAAGLGRDLAGAGGGEARADPVSGGSGGAQAGGGRRALGRRSAPGRPPPDSPMDLGTPARGAGEDRPRGRGPAAALRRLDQRAIGPSPGTQGGRRRPDRARDRPGAGGA